MDHNRLIQVRRSSFRRSFSDFKSRELFHKASVSSRSFWLSGKPIDDLLGFLIETAVGSIAASDNQYV